MLKYTPPIDLEQNAIFLYKEAKYLPESDQKIVHNAIIEQAENFSDFKTMSPADILACLNTSKRTGIPISNLYKIRRETEKQLENLSKTENQSIRTIVQNKVLYEIILTIMDHDYLPEKSKIEGMIIEDIILDLSDKITKELNEISNNKSLGYINPSLIDEIINADDCGALHDITDQTLETFYNKLAEITGWENICQQNVSEVISEFETNFSSIDIYEGRQLNPIYAKCEKWMGKIDGKRADYCVRTLLKNSAIRAATEILKDHQKGDIRNDFLEKYKTPQKILNAYQTKVAQYFEKSLITAVLLTRSISVSPQQNLQFDIQEITQNFEFKNFDYDKIFETKIKDPFLKLTYESIHARNTGSSFEINPIAVEMDSYYLSYEQRRNEKILKAKHIDMDKFENKFAKNVNVLAQKMNSFFYKGRWVDVLASQTALAVIVGLTLNGQVAVPVLIYAGRVFAKYTIAPLYHRLQDEMYKKNGGPIKSLPSKLKYIKKNWQNPLNEIGKAYKEKKNFVKDFLLDFMLCAPSPVINTVACGINITKRYKKYCKARSEYKKIQKKLNPENNKKDINDFIEYKTLKIKKDDALSELHCSITNLATGLFAWKMKTPSLGYAKDISETMSIENRTVKERIEEIKQNKQTKQKNKIIEKMRLAILFGNIMNNIFAPFGENNIESLDFTQKIEENKERNILYKEPPKHKITPFCKFTDYCKKER